MSYIDVHLRGEGVCNDPSARFRMWCFLAIRQRLRDSLSFWGKEGPIIFSATCDTCGATPKITVT